jgi:prolyl-tRNA synthetase
MVLEYVCSKGDRESHSVKESFTAVREHEERHISEYNQIAQKLGLKVINPEVSVFSSFNSDMKRDYATGGKATCQFMAVIDGEEVMVPVTKDGTIADPDLAKRLEDSKNNKTGKNKNSISGQS